MGRQEALQLDLEPENAPAPAPPRRSRLKAEPMPAGRRSRFRVALVVVSIVLGALAIAAGGYKLDEYLATDSHFVLAGTLEDHPNLSIDGAVSTPRDRVAQVFARDFGRSVYLTPLADRRRALLAIDWVREAAVERHWPDRISVHIWERKPVAFAMLPRGESYFEASLVDAEGVLLSTPPRARFALPALYGLTREMPPAARLQRVKQSMGLMEEVKNYAGQISEINAADPHNLTVTFTLEGKALRLMLGSEKYRERLQGFLARYTDINRRLPYARLFDLRLYPYITAQDGVQYAR